MPSLVPPASVAPSPPPLTNGKDETKQRPKLHYVDCCCTQKFTSPPTYSSTPGSAPLPVPLADVETLEAAIDALDDELRALSMDIHAHPEIAWQEHRTHDGELYSWGLELGSK